MAEMRDRSFTYATLNKRRAELVDRSYNEVGLRPQGVQRRSDPIDPTDLEPEAFGPHHVEGVGGDEEDLLFSELHLGHRKLIDPRRRLVESDRIHADHPAKTWRESGVLQSRSEHLWAAVGENGQRIALLQPRQRRRHLRVGLGMKPGLHQSSPMLRTYLQPESPDRERQGLLGHPQK